MSTIEHDVLRRRQPAILTPYDLRRPWHNVYGFPLLTGRLASGETLSLFCREDERVPVVQRLNTFLQSPSSLQRAQVMIIQLEERTTLRLIQLIKIETMPIEESDTKGCVKDVEQILRAASRPPTLHDRLACLLEPDVATDKIIGMLRTVMDLRAYAAGLTDRGHKILRARVQDTGGDVAQEGHPHHQTLRRYVIRAKFALS